MMQIKTVYIVPFC